MHISTSISVAVATATATLLTAGCGGSGKSPTTGARATHDPVQAAFRYSSCMRHNGAAGFPDPKVVNHDGERGVSIEAPQPKGSPQFRAAARACAGILPPPRGSAAQETAQQQHTRLVDALSFARCMRSRGVSRFPDPNPQGELSVETVQAQGIDVRSPSVLRVVQACLPASHGALTAAKVRAALAGGG